MEQVLEAVREIIEEVEACGFCGGDGGERGLAGFTEGDTGYVCLPCALEILAG